MFPFSRPQLLGCDVPPSMLQALQDLAKQNGRSVAAEAHLALEAWIAPPPLTARERRRGEVSDRLNALLQHVNSSCVRSLTPSHVAEAIGSTSVEEVAGWFGGEVEPTLQELAAVAAFFGGSEIWLQHGTGGMFATEYSRLPEDPARAVTWLVGVGAHGKASHIRFARDLESGSLAVIKQFGDWHCQLIRTPYVVADSVGTGGESALAHLAVMWQLMYEHYTACDNAAVIKSYLVVGEDFRSLVTGDVHPLSVLTARTEAPWWEDIWEDSLTRRIGNYWDGWSELCERIQRVVSSSQTLAYQVPRIRNRTHPFFQQIEAVAN